MVRVHVQCSFRMTIFDDQINLFALIGRSLEVVNLVDDGGAVEERKSIILVQVLENLVATPINLHAFL